MNPTVFVVDDNNSVLDFVQNLLRRGGFQVECFSSAAGFLRDVQPDRAGCLVVDIQMPEISGVELMQHLARVDQSRPAVMITGEPRVKDVVKAMKLGALDVVEKPFRAGELVEAVHLAQQADLSSRTRRVERELLRRQILGLSLDEQAVLAGLVRGLTSEQIATDLDVSLRTVQFRRSKLFAELNVKTKAELYRLVQLAQWPANAAETVQQHVWPRSAC